MSDHESIDSNKTESEPEDVTDKEFKLNKKVVIDTEPRHTRNFVKQAKDYLHIEEFKEHLANRDVRKLPVDVTLLEDIEAIETHNEVEGDQIFSDKESEIDLNQTIHRSDFDLQTSFRSVISDFNSSQESDKTCNKPIEVRINTEEMTTEVDPSDDLIHKFDEMLNTTGFTQGQLVAIMDNKTLRTEPTAIDREPSGKLQDVRLKLLNQIPEFTGSSSGRVDEWKNKMEKGFRGLDLTEEDKIGYFFLKLGGAAEKFVMAHIKLHPIVARNLSKLFKLVHDRYHGDETRERYLEEWENADNNPGESILDYADRLTELIEHAFPTLAGDGKDASETKNIMLKDRLRRGLSKKLREMVQFNKMDRFKELVDFVNERAIIVNYESRPKLQFINSTNDQNDLTSAMRDQLLLSKFNQLEQKLETVIKSTGNFEQISAINVRPNAPQQFSHFYQPNERRYNNNFQFNRNPSQNYTRPFTGCCNYCGVNGHMSRDCRRKRFCNHCNLAGHNNDECRSKNFNKGSVGDTRGNSNAGPTCENCRQQGHATINCKISQDKTGQRYQTSDQGQQQQFTSPLGYQNVTPEQVYQTDRVNGTNNGNQGN